jgi:Na+/H+ antiporter NhaD/arsenite permease-like protein
MFCKCNTKLLLGSVLLLLMSASPALASETAKEVHLEYWSIVPFVGILLSIAIIPLFAPEWWHHNFPKVSLLWGLPVAIWIIFLNPEWMIETTAEYLGFIALLGSLFVIAGGIYIKGRLRGTPLMNVAILALGCVLANFIGTTGASMILVRPLIRANSNRKHRTHMLVFFIFMVSNIGGCLTPLGDPPLFLGLLKGVPFFWTLKLWPEWLFMCGTLLALFFALDLYYYHHHEEITPFDPEPVVIDGKRNFIFLGGVMGAVLLYSLLPASLGYWREAIQISIMVLMAGMSYRWTPNNVHIENEFTWLPIREVAILFASIFACMIPALKLLQTRGGELGITQPWQFFWTAGGLSSFLDNAPTYLTFTSLGVAVSHGAPDLMRLVNGDISATILRAVSLGAVFMGANTYIGNGPNFMVKSLATHLGVRMPSFFGYMAWSIGILIPLFIAVTLIFFR